jgi:hypothetical protein
MWNVLDFVDTTALAMLIMANSAPVVVARILGERYASPIDCGRTLRDGRPLFGPHKTWRGLISGVLAAALTGAFLGPGLLVGTAFGVLALAGDLFSSFWKRRLHLHSGHSAPLLDQLPEALFPMLGLSAFLSLTGPELIGTAVLFTLLDTLGTRVVTRWHPQPKRQTSEQMRGCRGARGS